MKKIYFWSPYNSKIGTINSVLNTVLSIKKFSKDKLKPYLIDSTNEWKKYQNITDVLYLRANQSDFRIYKNYGFFWSRLFYLKIFFSCFFPLKNLLRRDKPEYLIAHLITSLPIFIYFFFTFKTKLILRISGEPKLNYLRKILWKLCAKNIYKVTCPSSKTKKILIENKIFKPEQIEILFDPVINIREINLKKSEKLDDFLKKNQFILSVGRLTKQKNFSFLISLFKNILILKSDMKLVILGEGEEKLNLEKMIIRESLQDKILLLGLKDNVFKYMKNAYCLVLTSLYENPGHVLIEAAVCNCPIISSDCPTGPSEILDYGNGGYLFKVNDKKDFLDKFRLFENQSKEEKKNKIKISKKKSLNYTLFRHFKVLERII